MSVQCKHANTKTVTTTDVPKGPHVCAECVRMGSTWVHLRKCLECGNVACCDSSPNQHARKHYEVTNHPIIRTIQPEDDAWAFCFKDEIEMTVAEIEHFAHKRQAHPKKKETLHV